MGLGREKTGGKQPPSHAQGAFSPLAGCRPPAAGSAGDAPALGWPPATPEERQGGGSSPLPPTKPWPGPVALAWPNSGRGSAARGGRRGATPALSGRRRPGVAVGHPKREGERGGKRREMGEERGGSAPPPPTHRGPAGPLAAVSRRRLAGDAQPLTRRQI